MSLRWKIAQSAEKKWWQRYLKNKDPQEYIRWKTNYWCDFLKKLGHRESDGNKVLDLGCGPAGIYLALNHTQVDAVDPLLDDYKNLDHFKEGDRDHVQFITANMEDFLSDSAYDTVYSLNAINHVQDWELAMNKVFTFVKPGGYVILSTDTHRYSWLKYPYRLFQHDILHPHQHSAKEYTAYMAKHFPDFTLLKNEVFRRDVIFEYRVYYLQRNRKS